MSILCHFCATDNSAQQTKASKNKVPTLMQLAACFGDGRSQHRQQTKKGTNNKICMGSAIKKIKQVDMIKHLWVPRKTTLVRLTAPV